MRIVVIGDIHVQAEKLWRMLREAGLADEHNRPTDELRGPLIIKEEVFLMMKKTV